MKSRDSKTLHVFSVARPQPLHLLSSRRFISESYIRDITVIISASLDGCLEELRTSHSSHYGRVGRHPQNIKEYWFQKGMGQYDPKDKNDMTISMLNETGKLAVQEEVRAAVSSTDDYDELLMFMKPHLGVVPAKDRKAEEIESHVADVNQIFEDSLNKTRMESEEPKKALEEVPELLLDQVD
jgi:hypothetical protein